MKKFIDAFFIYFPLLCLSFNPIVAGAETNNRGVNCSAKIPAIMKDEQVKTFTDFANSVCSEDFIDSLLLVKNFHQKDHCNKVDACASPEIISLHSKEVQLFVKENIPKAAFITIFNNEINKNFDFNVALKIYEDKYHEKICPDDRPDYSCTADIKKLLSKDHYSLDGYTDLESSTDDPQEIIKAKFFTKKIFFEDLPSKSELQKHCDQKLSLTNICQLKQKRIEEINKCDNNLMAKNCLKQEQVALTSLLKIHKTDKDLLLAIEKELCKPQRITNDKNTNPTGIQNSYGNSRDITRTNNSQDDLTQIFIANPPPRTESNSDNSVVGPILSDLQRERLRINAEAARAAKDETISPSETLNTSVKENLSNTTHAATTSETNNTVAPTSPNTIPWANDFSNKVIASNTVSNTPITTIDEQDSLSEIKKKDDISSLESQVGILKNKLEQMTQKVEDLKAKKEGDGTDPMAIGATPDEQEKELTDLKKKIADLDREKKLKEAELVKNKANQEEAAKAQAAAFESRIQVSNASNFQMNKPNDSYDQTEAITNAIKREREKSVGNFGTNGSSDFKATLSQNQNGSALQAPSLLVLKSAGTQANPDSGVVYMTASELQKYPYHLTDDASAADIENMLEKNTGAPIILGESEQIVPLVENGKIVLNENGKPKYKKVKISVVKNEKEKKKNIEREISSVADLKKEESKQRDLIRYQEMKNSLKIK
jgi:hypothetical protein